jgi:hypothetical protein
MTSIPSRHAEKNGEVTLGGDVKIIARVSVTDTGKGVSRVKVRWPLTTIYFKTLEDARRAFESFGQFHDVDQTIRSLIGECLDELEA